MSREGKEDVRISEKKSAYIERNRRLSKQTAGGGGVCVCDSVHAV